MGIILEARYFVSVSNVQERESVTNRKKPLPKFCSSSQEVEVWKKREGVHDIGRAWNLVGGDSGAGPLWRTEARFEGGSAFQMKPAEEHFN